MPMEEFRTLRNKFCADDCGEANEFFTSQTPEYLAIIKGSCDKLASKANTYYDEISTFCDTDPGHPICTNNWWDLKTREDRMYTTIMVSCDITPLGTDTEVVEEETKKEIPESM